MESENGWELRNKCVKNSVKSRKENQDNRINVCYSFTLLSEIFVYDSDGQSNTSDGWKLLMTSGQKFRHNNLGFSDFKTSFSASYKS